MKHYELIIEARSHEFIYTCSTAYEVLDALADASATFGLDANLDEAMCNLVEMKKGNLIGTTSMMYRMIVRDDEV